MTKNEKIAEKTIEILKKKYPYDVQVCGIYKLLNPFHIIEIISAFEKARKYLEKQIIKKRKEEETERINEKDIKGFTREDCD